MISSDSTAPTSLSVIPPSPKPSLSKADQNAILRQFHPAVTFSIDAATKSTAHFSASGLHALAASPSPSSFDATTMSPLVIACFGYDVNWAQGSVYRSMHAYFQTSASPLLHVILPASIQNSVGDVFTLTVHPSLCHVSCP